MTFVRVVLDGAFKKCCMRSGSYDGNRRKYFFPQVEKQTPHGAFAPRVSEGGICMYLRFVVAQIDVDSERALGVFHAVGYLRDAGKLYPYENGLSLMSFLLLLSLIAPLLRLQPIAPEQLLATFRRPATPGKVRSVDCLFPRGGVLAMRPLIVHASSKSRSEMSGRVLHIEYVASLVLVDGLELAAA